MLESALLAVTAFASTNIDDAFVLLAFFADQRLSHRHVVLGQYLGMAVLIVVALVFCRLASAIPGPSMGLMGVLPIFIGLKHFWTAWRGRYDKNDFQQSKLGASVTGTTVSVASVTIVNGGDNIAVYVPLFAGRNMGNTLVICAVLAAMVGIWCFGARWLVAHRHLGASVRRWGHHLMPFALIALGIYILLRSGAVDF